MFVLGYRHDELDEKVRTRGEKVVREAAIPSGAELREPNAEQYRAHLLAFHHRWWCTAACSTVCRESPLACSTEQNLGPIPMTEVSPTLALPTASPELAERLWAGLAAVDALLRRQELDEFVHLPAQEAPALLQMPQQAVARIRIA